MEYQYTRSEIIRFLQELSVAVTASLQEANPQYVGGYQRGLERAVEKLEEVI